MLAEAHHQEEDSCMSDEQVRLAVLIDADNISAKVAKDVFE